MRGLDVDFLVFSGYKVFGPMLGVLYGKKALLDKLDPYRVETNKNETPFKYEQGMLNNANLAGLEAALDYLLWLEAELFGKPPEPRPAARASNGLWRLSRITSAVSAGSFWRASGASILNDSGATA